MTRKRGFIILGVVVILAAALAASFYFRRQTGIEVTVETLRTRDLEALVSASGKIQPKRQINVSANTMGRVTRLAVEEGLEPLDAAGGAQQILLVVVANVHAERRAVADVAADQITAVVEVRRHLADAVLLEQAQDVAERRDVADRRRRDDGIAPRRQYNLE